MMRMSGGSMSEKCRKCLIPVHSAYCGCAYVDLFDCCTAPKEQYDACRFYINEEKNYMRCKHE